MLDWGLLRELREHWPAVKAAKWAVILAGLLGISLGFGIAYLFYQSRVDLWKDRALAWEQSGAGTPAEVKRILARRWTPLSDEEVGSLRIALRGNPKPPGILVRCGSSDCAELQESFVSLFRSIHWNADYEGQNSGEIDGIRIAQPDEKDHALADAITAATKGRLMPNIEGTHIERKWTQIFIGRKLSN
jgi:hypothetical protein